MTTLKTRTIGLSFMVMAALNNCTDSTVVPDQTDTSVEQESTNDSQLTQSYSTVFENFYPSEKSFRGSAIYVNEAVRSPGAPTAGLISDQSSEKFGYYVGAREMLEAGDYKLTFHVSQFVSRSEELLVRIEGNGDTETVRRDVNISPQGDVSRIKGGVNDVNVSDRTSDGYQIVTIYFSVKVDQRHRFLFYPAAGIDGKLDSSATGEVSIGGITLLRST